MESPPYVPLPHTCTKRYMSIHLKASIRRQNHFRIVDNTLYKHRTLTPLPELLSWLSPCSLHLLFLQQYHTFYPWKQSFLLRKQNRSWYHNVCTLSIITHLHSEVTLKYWAWSWKACVIPSTVPRMLPTWLWTPSSSSLWVFSNVTLLPRTHGSVLPVPPFLHIILPSLLLFLSHLFIRVSHIPAPYVALFLFRIQSRRGMKALSDA